MPISLPQDVAYDIRQPILGDSFSWAGVEPAPKKTVIDIHATASQGPNEDGFTMADYHVNHNGWGGVGVHFVVTKDSYPGRVAFGLPVGSHVQYVGDLLTYRAGVANNNPGRVHIEISGLFTPGNDLPSEAQLRNTRKVIDFLLAPNNLLPSLNHYNQVKYHNQDAIQPGGATQCPGWQHPQFAEWFGYLQGGAEPSWFAKPAIPIPVIVTPPVDPLEVYGFVPEPQRLTVLRDGAVASDVTTGVKASDIPNGTPVEIGGYFLVLGEKYYRTKWSTDNLKPIGIPAVFFEEPTGQASGPVVVTPIEAIPEETAQGSTATDEEIQDATVPVREQISFASWLREFIAAFFSAFIKKGN